MKREGHNENSVSLVQSVKILRFCLYCRRYGGTNTLDPVSNMELNLKAILHTLTGFASSNQRIATNKT